MRERELELFADRYGEPWDALRAWRAANPDASVEDAIRDLGLWRNPADRHAKWVLWHALKKMGDPAALRGLAAVGGKPL